MTMKMPFRHVSSALAVACLVPLLTGGAPPTDSPLSHVPPSINLTPGPEYGDDVRMFQGIPGIERSPAGRLWATWYGGGTGEDRHNYILLVTSGDAGKTWAPLKMIIDPDKAGPIRAFDPCPWLDPTGRLWLFWAQRGAGGPPILFATVTENPDDENATWSEPHMVHDGIMMCKPTVLLNGTWLLPTAIWRRDQSCRILASRDRGKTWSLRGTAGIPRKEDRNCDEPMIIERRDRSLWLLVRTTYGIGEAISTDKGKTWSEIAPSKIAHPTARFFIRSLSSGNLLLVKHGPIARKTSREQLTAFVSDDDGKTWEGGLLLDKRRGVSYPDGAVAADGTITIIYDYSRHGAKTIHTATFTEDDVLAKTCQSPRASLRGLVNQAHGVIPVKAPKEWHVSATAGFRDNSAAQPLLDTAGAELEPTRGNVTAIKLGGFLFSDRRYIFRSLPVPLRNKRHILSSINGVSAVCRKAGAVYVCTPLVDRNKDSVAAELEKQGFARVKLREFTPFGNPDAFRDACTTYQRLMQPGETLALGKWSLVIF